MVDAGSRNRLVSVERATASVDGYGAPVETWDVLASFWASYTPISDRERWASAQVGADVTARFIVGYSSVAAGITPADRLLMEGRRFGITGVKEIGFHEAIEITATANA